MEVASGTFTEPYRKKTTLPLGQLVEETTRRPAVPHHLLETQIFAKLKSNSQIQAEPSVLHFSGFDLGKDYIRVLKLINYSSEVITIHIIPTQTKYFQTRYTKTHRLLPGLSYTVKVHFCPDEWRYFYDCIRVHCKGDDNLLVPVHAYPVIDDLHIPSHIGLLAVPLGQSVSRAIPLSCSCPIDFEFQVYIIQPHKAFSVQPLSGVIPAHGKVEVMITFKPFQYGTFQVTLQVVISQFNSKPYVCTLSGSSSPHLALSQQAGAMGHGKLMSTASRRPPHVTLIQPRTKTTLRSMRKHEKPKAVRELRDADVQPSLKTAVDVSTHAGVAKMLIQQTDKMSSKELRQAMMSQTKLGLQTRQMKEALFENKVRQDVQEERVNHLSWQVHLGKDPVSAQTKTQIMEERDIADNEYKIRRGDVRKEGDFAKGQPKLCNRRALRDAGQAPEATPTFSVYSSGQLEVRQRALRLFQQAARKVVIRCRMKNRLVKLRELTQSMKRPSSGVKVEQKTLLKISPDNVLHFTFPIFPHPNQADELAPNALGAVPVRPIEVLVKPHTPLFSLKVPQHYKLMGYKPVSAFEAAAHYIPLTLARTLRTGATDELMPMVVDDESPSLSFTAPQALLEAPYAHPLRIFNPAPYLHAFKAAPLYLESDLEFHLCPLPRYTVPKSTIGGVHTPDTQKRFLDRTDVIRGVMTWKKFPSAALATLSSTPTLTSNWAPRMCDPFNTDMLPAEAPVALNGIPEDLREELYDEPSEGTGVSLTPEMIRAVFPLPESVPSKQPREDSSKDDRGYSSTNSLGSKVMARLNHLKGMAMTSSSLAALQENKKCKRGKVVHWNSLEFKYTNLD